MKNLDEIFRFNPFLIMVIDLDTGRFTDCNEVFTAVTGFSKDEVVGALVLGLGLWEKPSELMGIIEGLGSRPRSSSYEMGFRAKDNTERWGLCAFSKMPCGDQNSLLAMVVDITDQKAREQEFFRSEFTLNYIFKNADTPIYAKDPEGRFLLVNDAAARTIGYKTTREVQGRLQSDLIHGESLAQMEVSDRYVLQTGQVFEYEQEFLEGDRKTTLLARKSPLLNEAGDTIGIIGISTDITVRKALEAQLVDERDGQKRKNDQKNKLFTILAHDLRGPIGNLGVLLGLAVENLKPGVEVGEILVESKKAADQTYNLLDNLLGWVSGQLENPVDSRVWISVANMFRGVTAWLGAQAQAKGVKIELDCPGSLVVFGDERTIETIIRNLVSNAIKFSPAGSVVRLRGLKSDSQFILEVADQGTGMPPEKVAQLFRNQQVETKEGTAGERGNGLGLMFCAEMAQGQGGKIYAESIVGQGSTFRLVLPSTTLEEL